MPDNSSAPNVTVTAAADVPAGDILTPAALTFLASLHREFDDRRRELLAEREVRRAALASHEPGSPLDFPPATASRRVAEWRVAPAPSDLMDRRVEITGPVERKMMINALNSGARVFMADLEDSCSPTWDNIVAGQ